MYVLERFLLPLIFTHFFKTQIKKGPGTQGPSKFRKYIRDGVNYNKPKDHTLLSLLLSGGDVVRDTFGFAGNAFEFDWSGLTVKADLHDKVRYVRELLDVKASLQALCESEVGFHAWMVHVLPLLEMNPTEQPTLSKFNFGSAALTEELQEGEKAQFAWPTVFADVAEFPLPSMELPVNGIVILVSCSHAQSHINYERTYTHRNPHRWATQLWLEMSISC